VSRLGVGCRVAPLPPLALLGLVASRVAGAAPYGERSTYAVVVSSDDVVGGEVSARMCWMGVISGAPVAVLGAPGLDRVTHPLAFLVRVVVCPCVCGASRLRCEFPAGDAG
jgi:hypothetical protein